MCTWEFTQYFMFFQLTEKLEIYFWYSDDNYMNSAAGT